MAHEELKFIREAFETKWIAPIGPHVDAFEKEFCEIVGAKHAVALSGGIAPGFTDYGGGSGGRSILIAMDFIGANAALLFSLALRPE